jgi:catechol 2,3-dioxygenase-like lactoylglutathione lyase family enzyme
VTVTELRVALTVPGFDQALAFYRDRVGLPQLADWSSARGKAVLLWAGRATLELLDRPQAELVDQIEAGRRVAGPVRLAFEVQDSDTVAERLLVGGAERVAAPVTTPWGDRNARIRTPDGIRLTLFATPSTAVPASLTARGPAGENRSMPDRAQRHDGWEWPDSLEGLVAAAGSHHVLLETPAARVIEVIIAPGAQEPVHTHRQPSLIIIDQPARIRYYEHDRPTFQSPERQAENGAPRASWMEPEGPHSVENIDTHPYHAFRIEFLEP